MAKTLWKGLLAWLGDRGSYAALFDADDPRWTERPENRQRRTGHTRA